MGFMDKARAAAEQAGQRVSEVADQAGVAPPPVEAAVPIEAGAAEDFPEYQLLPDQVKRAAKKSRASLATVVEKIDPDILATLVLKATAAQEKVNIALRDKGSPYRIGEINLTASIPPQIGFVVVRIGDQDDLATVEDAHSLELLEAGELEIDESIFEEAVTPSSKAAKVAGAARKATSKTAAQARTKAKQSVGKTPKPPSRRH